MFLFRSALLGGWLLLASVVMCVAASAPGPMAAGLGYRAEEVVFKNTPDKLQLAGTLTIPRGAGPFPAVVLLSDMGAQNRDGSTRGYHPLRMLADYLSQQGIVVLRFDDRGVGQSEGDNSTATTADRVKDAQAALSYLRTRPEVLADHIGLIGHGEGGNVGLLAAAQPLPPAFLITLAASGQVGRELLAHQQATLRVALASDTSQTLGKRRLLAQQETERQVVKMRAEGANAAQIETALAQQQLRQKIEAQKLLAKALKREQAMLEIIRQNADNGQAQAIVANMMRQDDPQLDAEQARLLAAQRVTPWYRSYLNFDPLPGLGQVKCPVLLLHGLDDEQVLPINLQQLEKGLKSNRALVVQKLEGVNHGFQAPEAQWPVFESTPQPIFSPVALTTIRNWITEL